MVLLTCVKADKTGHFWLNNKAHAFAPTLSDITLTGTYAYAAWRLFDFFFSEKPYSADPIKELQETLEGLPKLYKAYQRVSGNLPEMVVFFEQHLNPSYFRSRYGFRPSWFTYDFLDQWMIEDINAMNLSELSTIEAHRLAKDRLWTDYYRQNLRKIFHRKLFKAFQSKDRQQIVRFYLEVDSYKDFFAEDDIKFLHNSAYEQDLHLQMLEGDYEKSAEEIKKALRKETYIDPQHMYYLYGKCLWEMGQKEQALKWLKMVEEDSGYFDAAQKHI